MNPTTETPRLSELSDDVVCRLAHRHARRFLRRFDDPTTRAELDDLVQESAVAAWRWADAMRYPERFAAAVRTIARRHRQRAIAARRKRHDQESAAAELGGPSGRKPLWIAGQTVPHGWAMQRLGRALRRLQPTDRCVLLAFQEGFCIKEIATRYGMSVPNVKVRAHRARRRVRQEIEAAAQDAAAGDGFELW